MHVFIELWKGNDAWKAASVETRREHVSAWLDIGSLIGRMLRLLAENAGAERAVLALVHEGALRVEAELRMDPEELRLAWNEPAAGSSR